MRNERNRKVKKVKKECYRCYQNVTSINLLTGEMRCFLEKYCGTKSHTNEIKIENLNKCIKNKFKQ